MKTKYLPDASPSKNNEPKPMEAIMEMRPKASSTTRRREDESWSPSAAKPRGSQQLTGYWSPCSFSKSRSGAAVMSAQTPPQSR